MSRKVNIICTVLCIVVILAVIGGMIFAVVRNGNDTPPDETQPPITDTTEPAESGTEPTIPVIPDITPDNPDEEDRKQEMPGDVTIDIIKDNENNERNDEPSVDGEVVIFPGVKGDSE